jgi:hypothetical protein
MTFKSMVTSSVYALAVILAASSVALADPTDASTSDTSSNGSSTGVGNAGSFGIGSGTANGNADSSATATSNGVSDSDNSTRTDSHNTSTNITAGAVTMSTASLSQAVSGIPASAGYNVPDSWRTGDITSASNTGSNGVIVNVANTGVSSNLGVVNSITTGAFPSSLTK